MGVRRGRVLMAMRNVAPWGGLHENVWYAARGAKRHGWAVTVACREGLLPARLRAEGIDVYSVPDWQEWRVDGRVLAEQRWDIVHGNMQASRKLAVQVARQAGAKLINTFHSVLHDNVDEWGKNADALIAVARGHANGLAQREAVDSSKVHVIPNCVPDRLFRGRVLSRRRRLAGDRRIVVASRLDPEKISLLEGLEQVLDVLGSTARNQRWTVQILGDGVAQGEMSERIQGLQALAPNVEFDWKGWVDSEEVPKLMRGAFLSIGSGRAAASSLAVGTPTVAFGSRGLYGLQRGKTLGIGVWGNFGGYWLGDKTISSVRDDFADLLTNPAAYADAQDSGREVANTLLRQSRADALLDTIYRTI